MIRRLQHILMTCRDDLTDPEVARTTWNKVFDVLLRADLTISAVTIMKIPRTPVEAAARSGKLPTSAEITTMPFGKHKDKTIEQIAGIDRPYLVWLQAKDFITSDRIKAAIREALEAKGPDILAGTPPWENPRE